MSDNTPFGLTNCRHANWSGGVPVAILNEASSMHDRIAYCWAAAAHMKEIAGLLSAIDGDDLSRVGSIFFTELEPLVSLLERMAQDAWPEKLAQEGGVA